MTRTKDACTARVGLTAQRGQWQQDKREPAKLVRQTLFVCRIEDLPTIRAKKPAEKYENSANIRKFAKLIRNQKQN